MKWIISMVLLATISGTLLIWSTLTIIKLGMEVTTFNGIALEVIE